MDREDGIARLSEATRPAQACKLCCAFLVANLGLAAKPRPTHGWQPITSLCNHTNIPGPGPTKRATPLPSTFLPALIPSYRFLSSCLANRKPSWKIAQPWAMAESPGCVIASKPFSNERTQVNKHRLRNRRIARRSSVLILVVQPLEIGKEQEQDTSMPPNCFEKPSKCMKANGGRSMSLS